MAQCIQLTLSSSKETVAALAVGGSHTLHFMLKGEFYARSSRYLYGPVR
jgi:hypothetical protein